MVFQCIDLIPIRNFSRFTFYSRFLAFIKIVKNETHKNTVSNSEIKSMTAESSLLTMPILA